VSFYAGFLTGVLACCLAAFCTLAAIAVSATRYARKPATGRPSTGVAPALPKVTP
jgi:hypothetical protein